MCTSPTGASTRPRRLDEGVSGGGGGIGHRGRETSPAVCDQAAVIRFFYVVMQLLGLAVVHFGASMDQGLLGPEVTRMLLAIGMGLQWVEPIRILTRHPELTKQLIRFMTSELGGADPHPHAPPRVRRAVPDGEKRPSRRDAPRGRR